MTSFLKTLTAAGAIAFALVGAASADDGAHKFEKAAAYYGECANTTDADFAQIKEDVRAFTDMTVMAETVMSPKKFFRLMDVLNDPRTIHVMANCATEPVMWDTWMKGITNPQKWGQAMATMMDPSGYVAWMMAPIDLDVYNSMAQQADLSKYGRWLRAPLNPNFYKPATSMLTLEWYKPRLAWMASLDSYKPLYEVLVPKS